MKRITITIHVEDDYFGYTDRRKLRNNLAAAAISEVSDRQLSLVDIAVKVGNVRAVKR